MHTINEHGASSETVESFAERNNVPARLPGDLVDVVAEAPFLPITDFADIDWQQAFREAHALRDCFVQHRSSETHRGWSSLCLHGISSVHTNAPRAYGFANNDAAPYRWTDVADLCPTLTGLVRDRLAYDRLYRVRIMKLAPGGFVAPHRDTLSLADSRLGPLNIAINNPDGCDFFMDGFGRLPFSTGMAIKLDLYNVHAVWNRSNEPRYHLIVHGITSPTWDEIIQRNYRQWISAQASS